MMSLGKKKNWPIFFVSCFFVLIAIFFHNCSKLKTQSDLDLKSQIPKLEEPASNIRFVTKNSQTVDGSNFVIKTGQIVGYQSGLGMVSFVTGSMFSHVGILVVENGSTYFYDSLPSIGWSKRPVGSDFVSGTVVMELVNPLSENEKNNLIRVLDSLVARGANMYNDSYASSKAEFLNYGQPNDTLNDNRKKACSEFVRYAFVRAGIPANDPGVGKVQKLTDFANVDPNINSSLENSGILSEMMLADHLRGHGLPVSKEYYAVSPDSIMNDKKLKMVSANKISKNPNSLSEAELHNLYDFGGKYLSEKDVAKFYTDISRSYPNLQLAERPRQPYPADWNQTLNQVNIITPTNDTTDNTTTDNNDNLALLDCRVTQDGLCSNQDINQGIKLVWTCNADRIRASCKPDSRYSDGEFVFFDKTGSICTTAPQICKIVAIKTDISSAIAKEHIFSLTYSDEKKPLTPETSSGTQPLSNFNKTCSIPSSVREVLCKKTIDGSFEVKHYPGDILNENSECLVKEVNVGFDNLLNAVYKCQNQVWTYLRNDTPSKATCAIPTNSVQKIECVNADNGLLVKVEGTICKVVEGEKSLLNSSFLCSSRGEWILQNTQ